MTIFIFCFLPVVLLSFTLANRYYPSLAAPILLLSSLVFYSVADLPGLPLLLASIIFNFWVVRQVGATSSNSRRWLIFGVVVNLLPLIFYKYLHQGPAISEAAGIFVLGNIPLGLSFYSFQQISCLVDVRKQGVARLGLLDHALFTSFFAQIPAGPISHYRSLAPQIAAIGKSPVPATRLAAGVSLFTIGLTKKVVIAGQLTFIVDHFYQKLSSGAAPGLFEAWVAAWAFLLQLYFDFSGYSDMALGIALCCGISLPPNFNSPLKALSGSEFVDRWHMSLVSWIREYLYQPLFNRLRKLPLASGDRKRTIAWAMATILSMAVIGAWHGSQITFLLSGIFAGILLVLRQLGSTAWSTRKQKETGPIQRGVLNLALLAALCLFATTIRAKSAAVCIAMIRAMIDLRMLLNTQHLFKQLVLAGTHNFDFRSLIPHSGTDRTHQAMLLLATLIVLYLPNTMQIFGILPDALSQDRIENRISMKWRPTPAWGIVIGGLLVIALLFSGSDQHTGFIYAQF